MDTETKNPAAGARRGRLDGLGLVVVVGSCRRDGALKDLW